MGLIPVAQLESYKGLWFATFDPEAPALREYLGEMAWYIDTFVDRREGGVEVIATHKWIMPCNWKFPAENFGGDAYHVQWNHLSAVKIEFSRGVTANTHSTQRMASPGNGHALICVGPDDVGDPPMPEIETYEREVAAEVRQRLGPRANLINPIVGTVFPNFSLLRGTSRTFRVWQPRGPEKTEVRSFVFMDKAAPPEVKKAIRQAGIRGIQPVRLVRAGRHGQLAGADPDLPRRGVTAHAARQPDGAWPRTFRCGTRRLGQISRGVDAGFGV